jgi:hypothetical protein
MWEGILWLEGFLGFEPRVAESQLLIARLCTGTLVRPLCLQGNAGRAQSLHKIIRLTTEENHGKTSVGVAEKRPTEVCWARFVWSTWWPFHGRPRPACWPSPPLACASGGLGHPSVRYLPSCRTKRFPHQPTLSRNSRLGI